MKIILDALGSDNAPKPEIEGAIQAGKKGVKVLLIGPEDSLKPKLKKGVNIEIYNCNERIEMEESPSEALRKKQNSTIATGINLLKKGIGDALVSAGNTGAVMGFSLFNLGTANGVMRPAIGGAIPRRGGVSILIDMGANVDASPKQLAQFAVMGSVYYSVAFKKQFPTVGLLSTGKEKGKGNRLIKETDKLLSTSPLNYIGRVEGRDLFIGTVDVVVCDGFVGNTVLKAGEALVDFVFTAIKESIQKSITSRLGALLLKSTLKSLKKTLDYSEYGGAPLLGIKKPVFICHGSSSSMAIKNAIILAKRVVEERLIEKVTSAIEESMKWLQ